MSRPHPALLMFVGWRHLEDRVMAALRETGYDDITIAQARIAARVADDGIRLVDLAAQAQVTKQTASVLVAQLEQRGYVERVAHPDDARARLIRLAGRGRDVQAVARRVERQVAGEWRRHLGAEGYRQLQDQLGRLRELVDPYR